MTRWNRRLLLGAIAVLVPILAGCEAGANAPTVEFHQASFGNSETVGGVTIDDAFVLGPAPGQDRDQHGNGTEQQAAVPARHRKASPWSLGRDGRRS